MSIMEKAAGLVNRRPGGVADHASHADQPPNNNAPIPLQLDAFDDDGQISAGLIPYGDGADKLAVVARLDRALASAATVDQVKEIHDLAVGIAAYARKAADTQLEADAVEFRMKAARRLGELMKAQKETIGFSAGSRGSPVKGARVDDKPDARRGRDRQDLGARGQDARRNARARVQADGRAEEGGDRQEDAKTIGRFAGERVRHLHRRSKCGPPQSAAPTRPGPAPATAQFAAQPRRRRHRQRNRIDGEGEREVAQGQAETEAEAAQAIEQRRR